MPQPKHAKCQAVSILRQASWEQSCEVVMAQPKHAKCQPVSILRQASLEQSCEVVMFQPSMPSAKS